ncbi:hypothetical protein [Paenibacillus glucanolyticus]|uniref:hypothetical protein n=1 Tax=Paenibacillus glucanolyticus TaxID=59843 RepID=UPI0030D383B1
MTPVILMEKLQEYLQGVTKDMALGSGIPPNIYLVDLPARATPEYEEPFEMDIQPADTTFDDEKDERWPFIVIIFTAPAEDNEEGFRTVQMDLIFGCEGSGPDGYMDVLHLMEFVRASFLRETFEGWPARLTLPLSYSFYEEQADPYWMGYMTTNWEMPSMVQEVWK